MCGRYRIKDPGLAFEYFGVEPAFEFGARYNIAPTQRVPVMDIHGLKLMPWGLPAKFSKGLLINARSETVREKKSFREGFAQRRCLMVADGFYEWTKVEKRPHLFTLRHELPFAIGAFYDATAEGERCCLLTTRPNAVVAPVHDRMPVIVPCEEWPEWLAPGELEEESFERLTVGAAAETMTGWEVPRAVNSARVDGPECCDPVGPVRGEEERAEG